MELQAIGIAADAHRLVRIPAGRRQSHRTARQRKAFAMPLEDMQRIWDQVAALRRRHRAVPATGQHRLVHALTALERAHEQRPDRGGQSAGLADRSEEHTSELQSLMRISYAVFCLKKKKTTQYKNYG